MTCYFRGIIGAKQFLCSALTCSSEGDPLPRGTRMDVEEEILKHF